LLESEATLKSARGEIYPVIGGVPVIVQGVQVGPVSSPLAPAIVTELMDALGAHASLRPAIEEAFSHKFTFAEDWMQAETDQFLHNVAASHAGLRQALAVNQKRGRSQRSIGAGWPARLSSLVDLFKLRGLLKFLWPKKSVKVEQSKKFRPKLSCIHSLAKLRPNTCVSVNIRLENCGTVTFPSRGPHPFFLSYRWIDANGVRHEGKRTELFADLPPGQAITVPLFIDTPKQSGHFRICIQAVQDNVQWFDGSIVEFDVEIGSGATTVTDPRWKKTGREYDYGRDHLEGVRLLDEWRYTLFHRVVECVVELGGNASPMIANFVTSNKFNIDIDPYGMIVGNIIRDKSDSTFRYIVADGMALPMLPRSIDMLVMFATFHHFPDPIELLSRLSDLVADDGLICLMCEPIGHVHRDTISGDYLAEVLKGVNEQSFELWEYQQMFEAANLNVVSVQIDVGSLKIALRPRRYTNDHVTGYPNLGYAHGSEF